MFQTGSRSYPERFLLGKIGELSVPGRLRARAIREQLIVLQVACKWHKTFVAGMGKFLLTELSAQLPFLELAREVCMYVCMYKKDICICPVMLLRLPVQSLVVLSPSLPSITAVRPTQK